MKILVATPQFAPQQNGVSYVVSNHVKEFAKRGHDVTVVTSRTCDQPAQDMESGVSVFRFSVSGSAYPRTRYRGEIKEYTEFVANRDCDIVFFHCWQTWSTDLAIPAFSCLRAKKVLVSHGVSANALGSTPASWIRWGLWRPYVWNMMPHMLANMDHVVLLSASRNGHTFYDHRVAQKSGYDRLSVIPNGADLDEINSASNTFRRDRGITTSSMLLCVGNYDDRKNQLATLSALSKWFEGHYLGIHRERKE
jgi:glycosyltransferase involved in cell wall biosynthesis